MRVLPAVPPVFFVLFSAVTVAQTEPISLEAARELGIARSAYLRDSPQAEDQTWDTTAAVPEADLIRYRKTIEPVLRAACIDCHGPDVHEASFRVDKLNPDLIRGGDEKWWLEVLAVVTNREMPPADSGITLADADRAAIVEWVSREIRTASQVRQAERDHSAFRRMTRYEYDYALRDLLNLPYPLAIDLPPETTSEDGFENSADLLQMSANQFAIYRNLARSALSKATVRGPQPEPVRFTITMKKARDLMLGRGYRNAVANIKKQLADGTIDVEEANRQRAELRKKNFSFRQNRAHFLDEATGEGVAGRYSYGGARYSWSPDTKPIEADAEPTHVLMLPPGAEQKIDLGDHLPDAGTLRVRLRASRTIAEAPGWPDLQIAFGYQPSNNSHTNFPVGEPFAIKAVPESPGWYEIRVPLGEISRNAYRGSQKLGQTPNPSEYLIVRNLNRKADVGGIRIERIEITAPHHDSWPPASHLSVFPERKASEDDTTYRRRVLGRFMRRAWRRQITDPEIDRKLTLHAKLIPFCDNSQEAMIEVLATVLSSPQFLYITRSDENGELDDFALATRLSMFLWSSIPDEELLTLAAKGSLGDPQVLANQAERMLVDPKAERFSRHFVRQWLALNRLDHLAIDAKTHPGVSETLVDAMKREPVEFFRYVLRNDRSIVDLLHADYLVINEALADHYRIPNVHGSGFQQIGLNPNSPRGGLLTQAGLLAMNSDGKDPNPLKRGIWVLEQILNDPPPPPPPAVPEIDLADPEILKLTLKERLEDHRNKAACMSCHSRIDPWGVAFENFDAVGRFRERLDNKPIDATSVLFNGQKLDGADGVKRYLLTDRQDQFTRAVVHKLTAYALGRPLGFADHDNLETLTESLRRDGDGLKSLVMLIVTSDLFQSN